MEEKIKVIEFRWLVIMSILTGVGGFIMGYSIPQLNIITNKDFDNFREVYHNDYITTIKLFIQQCSDLGNNSQSVVKHWVDLQGKHLGIIYKCSSSKPNNLTLPIQYTNKFYEVK